MNAHNTEECMENQSTESQVNTDTILDNAVLANMKVSVVQHISTGYVLNTYAILTSALFRARPHNIASKY